MVYYNFFSDKGEELWAFPSFFTDEKVEELFSNFLKDVTIGIETFEEYMEMFHPKIKAKRIFYTEIYL